MNEQELIFYKSEQAAIGGRWNCLMRYILTILPYLHYAESQIEVIKAEIDELRNVLLVAEKELLLRKEYRPIIEEIRNFPTRSETEKLVIAAKKLLYATDK